MPRQDGDTKQKDLADRKGKSPQEKPRDDQQGSHKGRPAIQVDKPDTSGHAEKIERASMHANNKVDVPVSVEPEVKASIKPQVPSYAASTKPQVRSYAQIAQKIL
jgi:hypothetical protein